MINSKLIVHFCHHKSGTVWFSDILKDLASNFNLVYKSCSQEDLTVDVDIWVQNLSLVNFQDIQHDYIGTHMIRDPRDIIVSGYFYHLRSEEEWLHKTEKKFGNRSYYEALKSMSLEEGLIFEMKRCNWMINIMKNWNYNNPKILELKYEKCFNNFSYFIKIFHLYGFNSQEIIECLKIAKNNNFENKKKVFGEKGKNEYHLRRGIPGDWENYFSQKVKEEFIKSYGDILIYLGYESDNNW